MHCNVHTCEAWILETGYLHLHPASLTDRTIQQRGGWVTISHLSLRSVSKISLSEKYCTFLQLVKSSNSKCIIYFFNIKLKSDLHLKLHVTHNRIEMKQIQIHGNLWSSNKTVLNVNDCITSLCIPLIKID